VTSSISQNITQAEEDRYAQLQVMALDFAREGNTPDLGQKHYTHNQKTP